jgi:hypothetical protein
VSYTVTLRTAGIFTAALIELDLDGLEESALIQYDVSDHHGHGLYANYQPDFGHVFCHALRSDYERHMDLLRNESPVYFKVGPPTLPRAPLSAQGADLWSLATSAEPVGEGPHDSDTSAADEEIVVFLGHEFGFHQDFLP